MIREEMKKKDLSKSNEGRILARTVARELNTAEVKKVSGAGCSNVWLGGRDIDVAW